MEKCLKCRNESDKTKIVISGPTIDQTYYQNIQPWVMNGQTVSVVVENEHLGQIICGQNQIQKNVDNRISSARKSLFSLLGPAFSYKCQINPVVKLHLIRTYVNPILRSGLSTFSLWERDIHSLSIFHKKTIKSCLKLSITAPTPALYFLAGELPIEAQIHRDMFSLF